MSSKINKAYVSPLDRFLSAFDHSHPAKSASQQAEIKKYKHIADLRDHNQEKAEQPSLWESF